MKSIKMKYQFIKKKFLLLSCALILPALLLGAILTYNTYRSTLEQIDRYTDNTLALAYENLDRLGQETQMINFYFENGKQFAHFYKLMNSSDVDYTALVALKYFTPFINSITNSKVYLDSLYVYLENSYGRVFTSELKITQLDLLMDRGWEKEFATHPDGLSWALPREIKQYQFEQPYQVLTVMKKFNQYNGGVTVNYKMDVLTSQMDSTLFRKDQHVFVLDENGKILLQSSGLSEKTAGDIAEQLREEKIASVTVDGRQYNVRWRNYAPFRAKVVTFLPSASVYSDTWESMKSALLLLLLISAATVLVAYKLAAREYAQLSGIIDLFGRAQANRPLPEINQRDDPYSFILNNIVRTFVKSSYLEIQLSERKYKLRTAEVLALQYQINPHFLFNTLQTISYEIMSLSHGESTQAQFMVEQLSDILRFSLGAPDEKVPLEEEIGNCKKYMEIQQVRYNDKFHVTWDVDEFALQQKVLRLILQPLMENSIQHGIRDRESGGRIKVKIRKKQGRTIFHVIDNGVGMNSDHLKAIQTVLRNASEQDEINFEHIGLFNCNLRLVLCYSRGSAIEICSRKGRGTSVWFEIPEDQAVQEESS